MRDLLYVGAGLATLVALTALLTLAMGNATGWRRRRLVVGGGALAVPAMLVILALYVRFLTPDGPPPNDAKGLAVFVLIFGILAALPVTFLTSASIVSRRAAKSGGSAG